MTCTVADTATATATATAANPRDLVSRGMFDRLVDCVMRHEQVDQRWAERVVGQTLAYLKACADNPGSHLSPTKAVDAGWHAFILHTEEYADFCARIAGRFIHHRPTSSGDMRSGLAHARTVQAIRTAGFILDDELWRTDPADCHQCHAGCHDSP